jgi:hypothetical protein
MYTSEDLIAIERAILDLQSGKRVTSVSYGDTYVQYAVTNLDDLLKLRNQIMASMSSSTKRQVIFSTSKGLK